MLFNSLTFVVFFAVVLALYYGLRSWTHRKAILVAASYLFYSAWNPLYIVLLWISTIGDWLIARRMYEANSAIRKKALLIASLSINLGLLGYFKYGGFLLDNFISAMNALGIAWAPAEASIVLPIGISFYTFQTLSYTLDVYRGQLKPGRSFLDFALFVSFFPQLVAGPIVRAKQFLPQCLSPRSATWDAFGWGLALLVMGIFAKTVLADTMLAPAANAVFSAPADAGFIEAWAGVFAFSGQIFFDFAGYSICAIGAAMCLGFSLPDNFRSPYAAIGFSDFWQRWHISLSQWLRDYLYISLGGNRLGHARTFANLATTMFLGGLWHGASWMFVIWGLLHGLYLIIEHALRSTLSAVRVFHTSLAKLLLGLLTFVIVSATWVFFRAESMHDATSLLAAMTSTADTGSTMLADSLPGVLLVLAGMLTWHAVMRNRDLESAARQLPVWVRAGLIAALLLGIMLQSEGAQDAFIYFQF